MICTFFGHKDAPQSISEQVENTIIDLIKNRDATEFYVGNHGNFDKMAYHALKRVHKIYPNIRYSVVIAYLSDSSEKTILRYFRRG